MIETTHIHSHCTQDQFILDLKSKEKQTTKITHFIRKSKCETQIESRRGKTMECKKTADTLNEAFNSNGNSIKLENSCMH